MAKQFDHLDLMVRHQAEVLDEVLDRVAALEKRLGTPPDVTLEEEIRTLKKRVATQAGVVAMMPR